MSNSTERDRWDARYTGRQQNQTLRLIWREAYGEDYPEEAEPNSFVTLSELRRIVRELRVGPGQTFADLGCGDGGPGLWVAREAGAGMIGIDFSPVAVDRAAQRAVALGLADRARFQVGDVQTTGLPDASMDGAMSVDVLLFVPDKAAGMREVARILRPGARFIFTSWDYDLPKLNGVEAPQVPDHWPLLRDAGLIVEAYEEPPDWRPRQRAVYDGILAAQSILVKEAGDVNVRGLIDQALKRPAELPYGRRVLAIVRKT